MAKKKKFQKTVAGFKELEGQTEIDRDMYRLGDAQDIERLLPQMSYMSTWSSPEVYARRVKGMQKKDAWQDAAWDRGDPQWSGCETMEQAVEMMENGWKEGSELIEKARAYILAQNPLRPKLVKYGIAGSNPCVPRAVAGNILNMRTDDSAESKRRPVITLYCDMAANCGISAEMITNRAAALAALIDEIEAKGYSCEVITGATSKCSWGWGGGTEGFTSIVSIVVKRSDQPVDIMKLSYTLGHASMFRRMIFADKGTSKACEDGLGSGLGSRMEVDIKAMNEKNLYYVPSAEAASKKFKDLTTAATEGLTFLTDTLRKQGCPALPKWTENDMTTEEANKKKWSDED